MQDAITRNKSDRGRRVTTLASGTLIALLAGAIGMQVARVKDGKAAEQAGPVDTAAVKMDALGRLIRGLKRISDEGMLLAPLSEAASERLLSTLRTGLKKA